MNITKEIKKPKGTLGGLNLNDEDGTEQPTKEEIQRLCEHLKLPFNREIAIALIYGDNCLTPERMLPGWLKQLIYKKYTKICIKYLYSVTFDMNKVEVVTNKYYPYEMLIYLVFYILSSLLN